MDELVQAFDEKRISKSSSQYDAKKLKWFNAHYIKNMDDEMYLTWVKKYFNRDVTGKTEEWVNTFLKIFKSHISYGAEINEFGDEFLNDEFTMTDEAKEFMESDPIIPKVLEVFKSEIENLNDWTVENLVQVIENVKIKAEVKGKLLYMPIRIATSGSMHGPELADALYLIGKETILKRI